MSADQDLTQESAPQEHVPDRELPVMTLGRLWAIGLIFVGISVAWFVLGASVQQRTESFLPRLQGSVESLWGGRHLQVPPSFAIGSPESPERVRLEPDSTKAQADLQLEPRRRGLLWYPTYKVAFNATYQLSNRSAEAKEVVLNFGFPEPAAVYDDFTLNIGNSRHQDPVDLKSGIHATFTLGPGESKPVSVTYRSQGLGSWSYDLTTAAAGRARDFALIVNSNFAEVDFPDGSLAPTSKKRAGDGWELQWEYKNLLTGRPIQITMPERLNPGPLVSRLSFFAPVSLLFFLVVVITISIAKNVRLHPVHYLFVGAAFFAFHLLFAYLVDHVDVLPSFLVASATSIFLTTSYLRVVTGPAFALREAGLSQLIFLVLFSYAFFYEGFTGLIITIGAIITLFVLMQVTARISWEQKFGEAFRRPLPERAAH